jgi:hypothetical protein
MNLPELIMLMQTTNMRTCMGILQKHRYINDITTAVKQYDPKLHKITDKTLRPDRLVKDSEGQFAKRVEPSRITLAIQKKIVLTAVGFLGTPKIECLPGSPVEDTMLAAINKVWEVNKLDYSFKNIAKKTMSQYHAAELWSIIPADDAYWNEVGIEGKFTITMQVLSECNGDKFYPVFDERRNMIAFGRGYFSFDETARLIQHFDVYTADEIYYSKEVDGEWFFGIPGAAGIIYTAGFSSIKNVLGKIPIVYYYQPLTEWEDVQTLIDRLELIVSNLADTNDYTGSPILVGSGETGGFADKGDPGKYFQLENGADLKYLELKGAPQSIEMEMKNLLQMIYSLTHTPDISFEAMKDIRHVMSGVAIKMLFMDAHLKAGDRVEIFGEGLQRRLNFIKAALISIDPKLIGAANMNIKPKFTFFLPSDNVEQITNINNAVAGGILSVETAVGLNPLVSDYDAELQRIKDEKAAMPAPIVVPPVGAEPVK